MLLFYLFIIFVCVWGGGDFGCILIQIMIILKLFLRYRFFFSPRIANQCEQVIYQNKYIFMARGNFIIKLINRNKYIFSYRI